MSDEKNKRKIQMANATKILEKSLLTCNRCVFGVPYLSRFTVCDLHEL